MPRVEKKRKSRAGVPRSCGRIGCGRGILAGDTYYSWSFRHGGTHYRCADHPPRSSELTQSKMSAVYAAIEDAGDALPGATEIGGVRAIIEQVAETAREVLDEYREAAEAFGGQGQNAERADELEPWVDELEAFDPEEAHDADPEPEPVVVPDEPPRDPALSVYDVPATGCSHQVQRDVYEHGFEVLNDDTWTIVAYDEWWVDEDGRIEADAGVIRRVKLIAPPSAASGGIDTIAGYVVERDAVGRHARRLAAAPPREPRPALSEADAFRNAVDEAQGLLDGCPV